MIENELKLALTEKEYNLLVAKGVVRSNEQINYYFYYDNMSLDIMVRIRQKSDKFTLDIKLLEQNKGNILKSQEHSVVISSGLAQAMKECGINFQQLNSLVGEKLAGSIAQSNSQLRCVGSLKTVRSVVVHNGLNIELDVNTYLDICDYELECECENDAVLNELSQWLVSQGIRIKQSYPKSKRFFDRLAGTPQLLTL